MNTLSTQMVITLALLLIVHENFELGIGCALNLTQENLIYHDDFHLCESMIVGDNPGLTQTAFLCLKLSEFAFQVPLFNEDRTSSKSCNIWYALISCAQKCESWFWDNMKLPSQEATTSSVI